MIDQILDFTHVRLGSGIPLRTKMLDLSDVCRLVVVELRGGAEEGVDEQL